MKFDDADIGGREVGAVHFEFLGDQKRGRELIGEARAFLGEVKNRMRIGELFQLADKRRFPDRRYKTSLLSLLLDGDIVLYNMPELKAEKITVDVLIQSRMSVLSIKGQNGSADTDKITIEVQMHYDTVAEASKKKIVGFRVHFQDTTPWLANIEYNVSEPLNETVSDPEYLSLRAWFRSSGYYALWDGVSESWYEWNGLRYNTYISYDGGAKDRSSSARWFTVFPYYGSSNINTCTIKTIYDDEYKFVVQTAGGMHIAAQDSYNHLYPKYTYNTDDESALDYVGFVAKTNVKDINEPAVIYEREFAWDEFWLNDPSVLTGEGLSVPKNPKFEKGWYGIMMNARRMEGEGEIEIRGGFTFVFELADGSEMVFDFTNLNLWSGHWENLLDHSPYPITAGYYYAMFNPELGIIDLYYETDADNNPFTDPSGVGRGGYGYFDYTGQLFTDVWKSLTPIRTEQVILSDNDTKLAARSR